MDIQLSSIIDFFGNKKVLAYKMKARYSDVYSFNFKDINVEIYNIEDKLVFKSSNSFMYKLNKDEIIIIKIYKEKIDKINLKISPNNHPYESPYDPLIKDMDSSLDLDESNTYDINKPAKIKASKRKDGIGLYINCNNPEALSEIDINKRLQVNQIKNKKVFFTFEHNNVDNELYYGYRLFNNSNKDAYVTILNMGFQLDGKGCWLGEAEWVYFYNANFRYDGSKYSDAQKKEFIDYFNFANNYKAKKIHPITYRIPKGKYIYIMGGTSIDAYKHINVLNTANKKVKGGCSNCACLFDVIGSVEGSFILYDDYKNIDNESYQGYVVKRNNKEYGAQLLGYDNCHGVVDTYINYSFNDLTENKNLSFSFTNYYDENAKKEGIPYEKINVKAHKQVLDYFASNACALNNHDAIGTDMTNYISIDSETKKDICIDSYHYDGRGKFPNIGNWMMDYMDYYTLINKGKKDRVITIKLHCTGSICVLVKDFDGNIISKPIFAIMHKSDKNKECDIIQPFVYQIKVKANETKKIIIEYNLLANSCGYIPHYISLG